MRPHQFVEQCVAFRILMADHEFDELGRLAWQADRWSGDWSSSNLAEQRSITADLPGHVLRRHARGDPISQRSAKAV